MSKENESIEIEIDFKNVYQASDGLFYYYDVENDQLYRLHNTEGKENE